MNPSPKINNQSDSAYCKWCGDCYEVITTRRRYCCEECQHDADRSRRYQRSQRSPANDTGK